MQVPWHACVDIIVTDEWGDHCFAGPRYFRCTRVECLSLVTHGMVARGGCWCGMRRLGVATRLTIEERARLKRGYYPLTSWEMAQIRPVLPKNVSLGWGEEVVKRLYA